MNKRQIAAMEKGALIEVGRPWQEEGRGHRMKLSENMFNTDKNSKKQHLNHHAYQRKKIDVLLPLVY